MKADAYECRTCGQLVRFPRRLLEKAICPVCKTAFHWVTEYKRAVERGEDPVVTFVKSKKG